MDINISVMLVIAMIKLDICIISIKKQYGDIQHNNPKTVL